MKKIALFALAALCVTAAQAVTCYWSDSKGFDIKSISGGDVTLTISITNPAEFNFEPAEFNFETASNGTSLFELGAFQVTKYQLDSSDSPSYSGRFFYDEAGTTGTISDSTSVRLDGDTSNVRLTGTTKYTFVFAYNDDSKMWDDVTITAVWGGQPETTSTLANKKAVAITADDFIGLKGYASDLGFTASDITLSGAGVVPEPTALALLALGVAGLALKRKNA